MPQLLGVILVWNVLAAKPVLSHGSLEQLFLCFNPSFFLIHALVHTLPFLHDSACIPTCTSLLPTCSSPPDPACCWRPVCCRKSSHAAFPVACAWSHASFPPSATSAPLSYTTLRSHFLWRGGLRLHPSHVSSRLMLTLSRDSLSEFSLGAVGSDAVTEAGSWAAFSWLTFGICKLYTFKDSQRWIFFADITNSSLFITTLASMKNSQMCNNTADVLQEPCPWKLMGPAWTPFLVWSVSHMQFAWACWPCICVWSWNSPSLWDPSSLSWPLGLVLSVWCSRDEILGA